VFIAPQQQPHHQAGLSTLSCLEGHSRTHKFKVSGRKGKKDDPGKDDDYQDLTNTVNVIFDGLPTKRSQKLILKEIMSIESPAAIFLKWSEVPITFYQADQRTSFFEPGRFPLVLDLVVAGSRLTKLMIDGGNGLNVMLAKTLKEMGLNVTDMLTKTNSPFYGIVPGHTTVPLRQAVMSVIFGTKENYHTEYLKFKVVDFETSYHAILWQPDLAKFMAIPHYVYLILKMTGPTLQEKT
jgi:hypothetical protein